MGKITYLCGMKITTKTKVTIENHYSSMFSYENWREDISYLATELNVFIDSNSREYSNPIENKTTAEDFKHSISVVAKGYSKGEWIDYTIRYNKDEVRSKESKLYLEELIEQLKRSFTHKHDYFVTKTEVTPVNGKDFESEPIDYTSFCINNVEFPEKEDIERAYLEHYGKDFDIIDFNID